jgi:3'-phosphoadenosine 5'-phosphosulfate sulfotransferase (PAPS reductase)/FAD synthetase
MAKKPPKRPALNLWPEGYRPTPHEILSKAIGLFNPVAVYVGFSGGDGSTSATHWMMQNAPGCEVFHSNTGIGLEATRQHVRDTCQAYGWKLHEIRAKEDCGQDYRDLCLRHGFPGPDGHQMMYSRLKERCVRLLVKRAKEGHHRRAKVMIASGICHDDSEVRMGYAGREINLVGSQLWINPLYWWTKEQREEYRANSGMPVNETAKALGMSGECGCGAFAQKGELARWRAVDPSFGEYIDALEQEVLERGFTWGWEGKPPSGGHNPAQQHLFAPMCTGCLKSAVVQEELANA